MGESLKSSKTFSSVISSSTRPHMLYPSQTFMSTWDNYSNTWVYGDRSHAKTTDMKLQFIHKQYCAVSMALSGYFHVETEAFPYGVSRAKELTSGQPS